MHRLATSIRAVDVLGIGGWFVVSRVWLAAMAVQPDPEAVARLWQLLPIELLESRLFESLWYLHSQPPLFNLIVGAALHLPGDLVWLRLLYWEVGLLLVLAMFWALRSAGVPRLAAHALVLVFSLNPTPALYENFLLYTYLEAFLMLAAMLALLQRPWSPASYGIATMLLVAVRSLFQPVWAAAVAWAICAFPRRGRLAYSPWVVAPILVGVLLIAKNGLLFGVWSTSSWYGLNLARMPTVALMTETQPLVDLGIVSPAFAVGPFQPVRAYPPALTNPATAVARERFGAPPALLHEPKDNGYPNMNHAGMIAVSRQLASDAMAATLARPGPVLRTMVRGLELFLSPASNSLFLADNRARLWRLDRIALAVLYPGNSRLLVGVWLLFAVASSGWLWLRPPDEVSHLRAAAAFVCVTILWVAAVANLTEFGENNRFRFTLDPMVFAWNCAILWWIGARAASRRRPDAPR